MRRQRRLDPVKLATQTSALENQQLLVANPVAVTSRENLLLLCMRHRRRDGAIFCNDLWRIDNLYILVLVLPLVVADKAKAA